MGPQDRRLSWEAMMMTMMMMMMPLYLAEAGLLYCLAFFCSSSPLLPALVDMIEHQPGFYIFYRLQVKLIAIIIIIIIHPSLPYLLTLACYDDIYPQQVQRAKGEAQPRITARYYHSRGTKGRRSQQLPYHYYYYNHHTAPCHRVRQSIYLIPCPTGSGMLTGALPLFYHHIIVCKHRWAPCCHQSSIWLVISLTMHMPPSYGSFTYYGLLPSC